MKTDFLKDLGIAQEAIDKIMAENGKDVEPVMALLNLDTLKVSKKQKTFAKKA